MSPLSVLTSVLLTASCLLAIAPGHAQAQEKPVRQDIAQGEQCLRQMERDPHGAMALAGNQLAQADASDITRMMALACLVRGKLMTGQGGATVDLIPELLQMLESGRLPPHLRVEMRLFTATAMQELGLTRQSGQVLQSALEESERYTNLHLQALVAVALHHARGMGDPAAAEPYFERAVSVVGQRPGGPIPADALPYFNYGLATLEQGRAQEAQALLETARDLASRDRHLERLSGRIEGTLARIALDRGDLVHARALFEEVIDRQRVMDDAPGLASSLRQLAELALLEGDAGQALAHGRESAEIIEHGQLADQIHESLGLMARIHSALDNAAESKAWSERARLHLAEAGRGRDLDIGATLDARAPYPDSWIDQLGSLTLARAIGALALLALLATLLVGGWSLRQTRRHQRQLAVSSATDALTGLTNRRDATRCLEALPEVAEPGAPRAALLLLAVDHFKSLNDEHGYEAGDRVLISLGQRLREICDANDVVARWGGDEFVVVRSETSPAAAYALAEHLRRAVGALVVQLSTGQSASVTVSIGVAPCPYFPGRRGGWQDAIRMAERALYAAKRSGRNTWVGTWGGSTDSSVDVSSVRQDPAAALARGWITASGSRPVEWSAPRDGQTQPGAFVKPA